MVPNKTQKSEVLMRANNKQHSGVN